MGLHRDFYPVGNHLQVQVGTVSRDAQVGTVPRETTVAQHEENDTSDEEHAEGEQRPQPGRGWRRSFCRARPTAWTDVALGRAGTLAQLARWARQAACASLIRVVGPGRARNAACLRQAGDPDGKVRTGRTQEWLNGRSWAVLAATVAFATASVVLLLARVAKVASRALVRTAGEVYSGQGQRRWRDPQAEGTVDGSIYPQVQHTVGWARGLGRGDRNVPQGEKADTAVNVATLCVSRRQGEAGWVQLRARGALDESSRSSEREHT